jgi:hypothetical protein
VLAPACSSSADKRNASSGATWNSSVNREHIRDCNKLMGRLVPVVIEIMLDHPETLWGDACYPVVERRD